MLRRALTAYLHAVIAHPRVTVAALALLAAASVVPGVGIPLDNDPRQFIAVGSSADEAFWEAHVDQFGADDTALVVLVRGAAFDSELISIVEAVGAHLAAVDGVDRVESITRTPVVASADDGLVVTPAFGPRSRLDVDAQARLQLLRRSHHGRWLLSEDGRTAVVSAQLAPAYSNMNAIRGPARALEAWVDAQRSRWPKHELHLAGLPYIRLASVDGMLFDLLALSPFAALLIAALLFLQFRRVVVVVLALSAIGTSVVITVGVIAALGYTISPLAAVFPTLLLVIGVADAVHVIERFDEEHTDDAKAAAASAGTHVGMACWMTSFTSAVAFASLSLTKLEILQEFGQICAIGIVISFVVTLTLVPVGLSRWAPASTASPSTGVAPWLEAVVRWSIAPRRKQAFAIFAVLLVAFLASASRSLKADYCFSKALDPSHPVSVASRIIDDELAGFMPLEINLSGEADAFRDPGNLARLAAASAFVSAQPTVGAAVDLAGVLADLAQAVSGAAAVPDDEAEVAQLLLLAEGDADGVLQRMVSDDYSTARIAVATTDAGGLRSLELAAAIDTKLADLFADAGVTTKVTGVVPLYAAGISNLIEQLVGSLVSALAIIVVTIALVFRSLRLAIVSIVPNVLPVLLVSGAYGLADRPMDFFGAITFCIAGGIAVDDTIHLLARYAEERRHTPDRDKAIAVAVSHSMTAVVSTSVALVAGLLVLLLSEFEGTRIFGGIAALMLVIALIADLVLTPPILALVMPAGSRGEPT